MADNTRNRDVALQSEEGIRTFKAQSKDIEALSNDGDLPTKALVLDRIVDEGKTENEQNAPSEKLQTSTNELKGLTDNHSGFVAKAADINNKFPSVDINQLVQSLGVSAFKMNEAQFSNIDNNKLATFDTLQVVPNLQLADDGVVSSKGISTRISPTPAAPTVPAVVKKDIETIAPEGNRQTLITTDSTVYNFKPIGSQTS